MQNENFAPKSVRVETLGCRLNQQEAESIAQSFGQSGFLPKMQMLKASDETDADCILCVINSCTVTARADAKTRRAMSLALRKLPNALIVTTGCLATLEAKSLLSMDERVFTLRNAEKPILLKVADALAKISDWRSAREIVLNEIAFAAKSSTAFDFYARQFTKHSRATLKIQDGCDEICAYCRTRFARGKSISLDAREVLRRVKMLEADGMGEVGLTGVHISDYHSDLDGEKIGFSGLLRFLLENTRHIALRLSSLHPEDLDEDFFCIAKNPRLRPHFHFSLQSGSDKILALMKRKYNAAVVLDAVQKLRDARPDAFFACDAIIGFPGENDDDFEQTLSLCRACRFAWIHAFEFSARPGTEAFAMRQNSSKPTIKSRCERILALALEQKTKFCESQKGKIVLATIEKNRIDNRAVTENFLRVKVLGEMPKSPNGEMAIHLVDSCPLSGREGEIEMTGVATSAGMNNLF